jgi:glucosamine-6-phosphate deaminase
MKHFKHGTLRVRVFTGTRAMARAAAREVSERIRDLLGRKETVNIIFSGAESQQEFHRALAATPGIDWQRVNAFAVDDFHAPGMDPALSVAAQPQRDLYDRVHPRSVHAIHFDAPDPEEESRRYEALIRAHPPDIACLGIGVSGHIAFNEPGPTRFDDERKVRVIAVSEESKRQLEEDPNFARLDRIPDRGITVTVAELMRCPNVFVVVPYSSKAPIVERFFASEVTEAFPATILKQKEGAVLYLDADSYRLVERGGRGGQAPPGKGDPLPRMPIPMLRQPRLDGELSRQYLEYVRKRAGFLLDRFRRYPGFPGVHTGYDSISGEEFPPEDIYAYSWINGRGAGVFTRFADRFPEHREELLRFARHTIEAMEDQWAKNNRHFPFMAHLDGREKDVGCAVPPGHKSYSDLYACAGFVEFGARTRDARRTAMALQILEETLAALDRRQFVTEPSPTPDDRILENPWSVAVDLTNEFVKLLDEPAWLQAGARLIEHLLDRYYLPDLGAFVEYITPDGRPFVDEEGRHIVDPGHAIEFSSFCLEFSRLAERHGVEESTRRRVNGTAPRLILWNIEKGWNRAHPGIYKTIDAASGAPVNDTMPWWILPETLLAVLLAYERTRDPVFLERFQRVHNAYFGAYMNPKTGFGPFQNLDGKTGRPIRIVPACKFQDPEFHSGKNILAVVDAIGRIGG